MKVIWLKPALSDLEQIVDYLLERNPQAALAFMTRSGSRWEVWLSSRSWAEQAV